MRHENSENITKLEREAPRNSTPVVDDNYSCASGAVARRPRLRGHLWVTAIDAHCDFSCDLRAVISVRLRTQVHLRTEQLVH
ncbi:hypothetical protein Y032_0020g58 [Ancylostoma ceylanicum]|uniref:Uncharacterized protein n=1 Tax=Ancylostoma ceylanicum TaxID=53326 RepID=A0A016V3A3_9BILA|nr:hypothetical protein Y032_0020g58 [Ancylostoma ceylanicum]